MSISAYNGLQSRLPWATTPFDGATASSTKRPGRADATPLPTASQLQAAVDRLSNVVQERASELRFSIDDETGKPIVRITDRQTGETIRQIPSTEFVEIAKSLDALQGLLLRQKA